VMMVIAVGVFNVVQPRWANGDAGDKGHKRVVSDEEMVEGLERPKEGDESQSQT